MSLVLVVPDADATVAAALRAGAVLERPVTPQDDGSRAGWIIDPAGHRWNLHTPAAPLPVEQLRERIGDRYDATE